MKPQLKIKNYQFDTDQVLSISAEITPSGKTLRISVMDDNTYNISFIDQLYNDSSLFSHIFVYSRWDFWTDAIRYEEPIISDSVADDLFWHQKRKRTKVINKLSNLMEIII